MDIPFTKLSRYVPTRWLSVYDCSVNVFRLLPAIRVLWYGLLSDEDLELFKSVYRDILAEHGKLSTILFPRLVEIARYLKILILTRVSWLYFMCFKRNAVSNTLFGYFWITHKEKCNLLEGYHFLDRWDRINPISCFVVKRIRQTYGKDGNMEG